MLKLLNNFLTNSDNFTIIVNFIEGQGQDSQRKNNNKQPSLIVPSGVGYMDQITP